MSNVTSKSKDFALAPLLSSYVTPHELPKTFWISFLLHKSEEVGLVPYTTGPSVILSWLY